MKTARIASLLIVVVVVLVASVLVYARELSHPVHRRDGKNVVPRTGEVLDFRLTAERDERGNVLVRVAVPPGSALQKASYQRLEIRKDGKILLWSRLATRQEADGSIEAGFQIDESLVGSAYVSFAYDATKEDAGGMKAYQVAVQEYVTERAAGAVEN
jgi:hypothetical protein